MNTTAHFCGSVIGIGLLVLLFLNLAFGENSQSRPARIAKFVVGSAMLIAALVFVVVALLNMDKW
jgi:hypothetical protein